MAELVEMRAQGVHRDGVALDELRAGPEQDGAGLLLGRLGLDKAHGRPKSSAPSDDPPDRLIAVQNGLIPVASRMITEILGAVRFSWQDRF